MIAQEIVFGLTGQTFFYDPPEGQPTGTPTLQVFQTTTDDDGTAETAAGACSVDSVSTTLGAAASIGGLSLTVASGTGITRKRRYLLTDVDGDCEWVECVSITGTTVGLRHPLKNNYAITTSTFKGCRISANVDSTWVSTKSKITDVLDLTGRAWKTDELLQPWVAGAAGYRLRWSYTVASVATVGVSFADLVRYQAKNLVTPLDVDRRFPGWLDRLPTDYIEDQGVALIEDAFQNVKMDALGDSQVLRRIRDTQVIRDLTIHKANVACHEAAILAGGGNSEALKLASDLYERRYKQLIREPKVPVDQTSGGSASQPTREPAWRR
jgi:hypothetical protein